ncbi:MAG: LamG domain-containing protein [Bacteroidetes bacterium]|nr:LamG domain-containing protein [Bacteroidota bacterium]
MKKSKYIFAPHLSTLPMLSKRACRLFSIFCILLLTLNTYSQGIAINTTGVAADNSAMLDINATGMNPKAGLLIPRMTTTERNLIVSPAEGLQIYNTSTQCFEAYYGSGWQSVSCLCTSPAAAGTISGTSDVCPGQNAVLYSVPAISGATNYIWSYSGTGVAIIGSTDAVIIYFSGTATSGNLTVMGTNNCGNGTVSANYGINVNSAPPDITGQPANPAAVCADDGTSSFTITATGALTYQWQEYVSSWNNISNGGVYSNVTTSTLTITNPPASMDGYKYRCIIGGTCTNSSTSNGLATLTFNPNLPASVSIAASATSICSGTSVTFTATPTNGGTPSYQWKVNGLNVGTNSNTYTSSSLANGNAITCVMTSNASPCLTGSPATSNTITMTVTSLMCNLISYWKLNGNSNDAFSSNNGSDASITYSTDNGKISQGAGFVSANSSKILFADASLLKPTGNHSVSFWFKTTTSSGWKGIFQSYSQVSTVAGIQIMMSGANPGKLRFVNGNNQGFNYGTDYVEAISSGTVNDGSWHFAVCVSDGSTLKIYLDGNSSPVANVGWTGGVAYTSPSYQALGCFDNNGTPEAFFDGSLDEVSFWSRALTTGEISQLYNSGTGLQYPF